MTVMKLVTQASRTAGEIPAQARKRAPLAFRLLAALAIFWVTGGIVIGVIQRRRGGEPWRSA